MHPASNMESGFRRRSMVTKQQQQRSVEPVTRPLPTQPTVGLLKVLVATHETQGQRKNDFCWCTDGEPVYFGWECDRDCRADGKCGCKRSFCGMTTHKATTTCKVVECETNFAQLRERFLLSQTQAGWISHPGDNSNGLVDLYTRDLKELLAIAARVSVGTVLEKRGASIRLRVQDPSQGGEQA